MAKIIHIDNERLKIDVRAMVKNGFNLVDISDIGIKEFAVLKSPLNLAELELLNTEQSFKAMSAHERSTFVTVVISVLTVLQMNGYIASL